MPLDNLSEINLSLSEIEVENISKVFQKGIIISTKSLRALFPVLKEELQYILTHRLNQDRLENFFSQVNILTF